MSDKLNFSAGAFSSWLHSIRDALVKNTGMNVPCDGCNACCTSSMFIHIKPNETEALARIPKKLLFPAPGLPDGNMLLGYFDSGHCPMLSDGICSIYKYRPLTCRNFDCRLFPATKISAKINDKAEIAQHAERWKFDYPNSHDRIEHNAVKAATQFLCKHSYCFSAEFVPRTTIQLAIFAIKAYDAFVKFSNRSDINNQTISDSDLANALEEAYKKFEARIQH